MPKALIDGDVFVYRAAFATNDETAAHAITAFNSLVATSILESGCMDYQLYLTGSGNFRFDYAKTAVYKGNRANTAPPIHKDVIREYAMANWEAIMTEGEEADDIIAIAATDLGPAESVIISIDKDFIQVPGSLYNPVKKSWSLIDAWSGLMFFYQQIIMGDSADNIIGIRGIGPAKSAAILDGAKDELELYNRCIKQYNGDEARVIENARLLWLRREKGQIWQPPI